MKILYAIQGTGNGHIARAEEIIPILSTYGKLDLFVSGSQADIKLSMPVKYKSKGLSFFFGKKGGIDFIKTFKNNNSKRVVREIKEFPVEKYDLVINDFEAITAWACHKRDIPCIALSHQYALLSSKVPKPKHFDPIGTWFLNNYAPIREGVGFHFASYDQNIFTPVIRERIRKTKTTDQGHYTVYLPAYDDKKLLKLFLKFPRIEWHIFSKHVTIPYHIGKISVFPVDNEAFTISLASSHGVLCGAGFETPAETLYLQKKLMVVPMKNQYEQHFNATSLKQLGVPAIKKVSKKNLSKIEKWIETQNIIEIDYKETALPAIERVFKIYADRK
ncbi:MAG: glycosyl transferase [Cyclobacteriaceae bacterium]|nr:glycosyl transferase [Cyclobacteriaceae bacterium]